MKRLVIFACVIISLCSWRLDNPVDSELYYKYIDSFFTFQDSCGKQFYLDEQFYTYSDSVGYSYSFNNEIDYNEFYTNCSDNILDCYFDYVYFKIKNCNTNKDSVRKVIIERTRTNDEYKQSFYSIYCQYYNLNQDTLFGLEILKKDTLTIDSLENIALLAFTCDEVDSVDRYIISHFCGGAGSGYKKDVSSALVYNEVTKVIMTTKVKKTWIDKLNILETQLKARIIDGTSMEEIREKIELRLRKEIKESGVLSEAILTSYRNKKYTPYIIKY